MCESSESSSERTTRCSRGALAPHERSFSAPVHGAASIMSRATVTAHATQVALAVLHHRVGEQGVGVHHRGSSVSCAGWVVGSVVAAAQRCSPAVRSRSVERRRSRRAPEASRRSNALRSSTRARSDQWVLEHDLSFRDVGVGDREARSSAGWQEDEGRRQGAVGLTRGRSPEGERTPRGRRQDGASRGDLHAASGDRHRGTSFGARRAVSASSSTAWVERKGVSREVADDTPARAA